VPQPENILRNAPRLLRSTVARGLATGPWAGEPIANDEGDFGAGVIRGAAIITRGEALGHGLWCDTVMLQQAADAINDEPKGAKARFTHPDLSGDGLGKGLGRAKNASPEGDVVRGELHFSRMSHKTPEGDLAAYVMGLATEDPEAFGISIAFEEDFKAEADFLLAHGAEWTEDDYGRYLSLEKFKSPDPLNTKNLPHARLASLRAVDVVDDPAANPNGLFHRGDEVARDAEQLLAWTLGLSAEKPQLLSLDINPDRLDGFVQRFMNRHGLTLMKDGAPMPAGNGLQKFAQGLATQLAADDTKDDKEKDKEKKKPDDENTSKADLAAGAATKLAEGGEEPGNPSPDAVAETEEEKQRKQKEVADASKANATEGTPVASPGSDKSAVGPLGDASNNVGYSYSQGMQQFRAECQRFITAFGAQGGTWFAEGKTFEQAAALHTAALAKENAALKTENEQLRAKNQERRGLAAPLNTGGDTTSVSPEQKKLHDNLGGGGIARFAAAIVPQHNRLSGRN
jgi:hypothetical protein